jgi:hypothetical protein
VKWNNPAINTLEPAAVVEPASDQAAAHVREQEDAQHPRAPDRTAANTDTSSSYIGNSSTAMCGWRPQIRRVARYRRAQAG